MGNNAPPSKKSKIAKYLGYGLVALFGGPPALMVLCCLLIFTWIFCGWIYAYSKDHISGKPVQLEHAVFLASPDRKTEFVAERDGTFQLVNITTGKILQAHTYATEDYRSVDAKWSDNDHLDIRFEIRYPAMALAVHEDASVKSGFSPG